MRPRNIQNVTKLEGSRPHSQEQDNDVKTEEYHSWKSDNKMWSGESLDKPKGVNSYRKTTYNSQNLEEFAQTHDPRHICIYNYAYN
jgi:hypothetical protein